MAFSKMPPTKPGVHHHFRLSESRRHDLQNFSHNFRLEAEKVDGTKDLIFKSSKEENLCAKELTEKAQATYMEWHYRVCKKHGFPNKHLVGLTHKRGWEIFVNRKKVDALSIPDTAIYLKWYGATDDYMTWVYGTEERFKAAFFQGLLIYGMTERELDEKISRQSFADFLRHELTKQIDFTNMSPELNTTSTIPCKNETCDVCFVDGIFIGDYIYVAMQINN